MTLVRIQPSPAGAGPVHRPVAEAMDAAGPQVCDDMSVEVALAVMAAALTGRLAVCDQDGRCTGLVTRTELAAVRESSAYTDRVRLRDVLGGHGSPTSLVTGLAEAGHPLRRLPIGALPVAGAQDLAPGVPALSR